MNLQIALPENSMYPGIPQHGILIYWHGFTMAYNFIIDINIDYPPLITTDECYVIQHNSRGIVGMANHGHNTNSSQFYITLKPTPWMDTVYVAFG